MVQIEKITINELDIDTNFYVIEKGRSSKFHLQKGQEIQLTFHYSKGDIKPETAQIFVKKRFGKPRKIDYVL